MIVQLHFNNSTDLSYPQRLSSCIQRLDWLQLPATMVQLHSVTQQTSDSCNDRPAALQQLDRPQLPITIIQLHFNNSTDLSYSPRSTSCIQRLDQHQLPATIVQLHSMTRLTSASRNDRPAIFYDSTIPATNITHLAEDTNTTTTNFTHCKNDNKLSSLLYLLPRLCFLHCLWLSLLARFNLNHLWGRRAYWFHNKLTMFHILLMVEGLCKYLKILFWMTDGKILFFLSNGPPHIAMQKQDDQHEHTFSNYVRIRDVVLKTCLRRWTIGKSGERGISMLPARHDDDDEFSLLSKLSLDVFFIQNKQIFKWYEWFID